MPVSNDASETLNTRDRERSDQRLRDAESRIRAIVDAVPALISYVDRDCRYVFVNRAYEVWFGHSAEEIAGRHVRDVLGEAAWEVVRAHVETVLAGKPVRFEALVPYKDGGARWVDVSYAPDHDTSGAVRGYVANIFDVSERKHAELERERLAAIVENSNEFVATTTTEGDVLYINEAGRDLVGLDHTGQARRLISADFLPLEWQKRFRDNILPGVLATGYWEGEVQFRHFKSGRVIDVWQTIIAVTDPHTGNRNFVFIARDETERKRAERDLRSAGEELAAVVRQAPIPIFVAHDAQCRRITANPAALALVGETGDSNIANRVDIVYRRYGKALSADELPMRKAIAGAELVREPELELQLPGRSVFVVGNAMPLFDSEGRVRGAIAAFADITERRHAEQALQTADRRKDEFLATLAHELRNPLAPLRNGLQLLQRTNGDLTLRDRTREMMERQLTHLVRLVDDLLDVSRISHGRLELRRERVALATVLRNAVEQCQFVIDEARREFELVVPDETMTIDADPVRVAQVICNLIHNAIKYTDAGGAIVVVALREGAQAVIRVRDDGVGIAAHLLPHVFDMFSHGSRTPDPARGGLGIGLSIVKQLVQMHGGTVVAASNGPGQGSEFIVRLPLAGAPVVAKPPPQARAAPAKADGEPAKSRRILVVDDNADAAESLAMLLELMGHEVSVAYNGRDAVDAAAALRPDMILLDIGMPELNGYDACERIRSQPWGRDIAIVALTGWGQEADRRRSQQAGFDRHLVKPLDPAALGSLVAELVPKQGRRLH